jgi:hypothetical protein
MKLSEEEVRLVTRIMQNPDFLQAVSSEACCLNMAAALIDAGRIVHEKSLTQVLKIILVLLGKVHPDVVEEMRREMVQAMLNMSRSSGN